MTRKLAAARRAAKSGRFPKGNPNFPARKQISPVMQKVRGSLSEVKSAEELHFLTSQPLSICQKLLSGHREPNAAMYEALFQTALITDAILGLTEGATDPKVRAVRKAVKRLKLEDEIARLEAGDDE
jgi:hypothetical protein